MNVEKKRLVSLFAIAMAVAGCAVPSSQDIEPTPSVAPSESATLQLGSLEQAIIQCVSDNGNICVVKIAPESGLDRYGLTITPKDKQQPEFSGTVTKGSGLTKISTGAGLCQSVEIEFGGVESGKGNFTVTASQGCRIETVETKPF